MTEAVNVTVRSALGKVIDELSALRDQAGKTAEEFKKVGEGVDDGLKSNVKTTENYFSSIRNLSRRLADQLRGDFKSLLSLNAVQDALKISSQFRGAVKETVSLSDTIRKLGPIFGIAATQFSAFQEKMSRGLGDVGLGAEVATNSLTGLASTQVRNQDTMLEYAKTAGALASITKTKGSEGELSNGMAGVIQSRGGNVNDASQVRALGQELLKVNRATGQSPQESLKFLQQAFAKMTPEIAKALNPKALSSIMTAGAIAGPGAVDFMTRYMAMSPIERSPYDSQGGGKLVDENGLNLDRFKKFFDGISKNIPGDRRKSLQTLPGIDDAEANSILRLLDHMPQAAKAIDQVNRSTLDLMDEMKKSFGMTEAFRANIAKVSSYLSGFLSTFTQKTTDVLSGTSGGAGTAALVTGASAVVAAMLGSGGIKNLLGTVLKTAGTEAVTGKEAQPVIVTNWPSSFGSGVGGLATGAAEAAGGLAVSGLGALVLPLAALTAAIGGLVYVKNGIDDDIQNMGKDPLGHSYSQGALDILRRALAEGKVPEGQIDTTKAILQKFDVQTQRGSWQPVMPGVNPNGSEAPPMTSKTPRGGSQAFPGAARDVKVRVELASPQLKTSIQPSRGGTL